MKYVTLEEVIEFARGGVCQMRRTIISFGFLFALALLSPALFADAADPPRVFFDQGHGQRFLVDKDGPLNLSSLARIFHDTGWQVISADGELTPDILAEADALIISGAFGSYTPEEIDRIVHYVENGGHLAIMLHIGPPLADLLHRLDVDVTNRPISERENIIDGEARNFGVRKLSPHPLTAGLDHFSVYGCWAVANTNDGSAVIAASSDTSFIDMDGDGKASDPDAVQAFGVLVAGSRGKGRFAVFGDDAIFQNRFLDESNRQLAGNLAAWLR